MTRCNPFRRHKNTQSVTAPVGIPYICVVCGDTSCIFRIDHLLNDPDMFRGYKIAAQRLFFAAKVCQACSGPIRERYNELQHLCNRRGVSGLVSLRAKELLPGAESTSTALELAEAEVAKWSPVEREAAQQLLEQRRFPTFAEVELSCRAGT